MDATEVRKTLDEYCAARNAERRGEEAARDALTRLNELCGQERRAWRRKARAAIAGGRPQWTLDDADCGVVVDHSTKTYSCSLYVHAVIRYCIGTRRGKIELSGGIEEQPELLAELAKLVDGEAR